MEYTDIRYSDITTCIDLWVPEQHKLEDGWSPNELCGGEQSHAYIIKHPMKHNWLLAMEYTDIRYSDIPTCIDSVRPEQHNWRTDGSPNELCEESSLMLHIKHPIETQLTPCDGIHWHQGTVTYYLYWCLWVPEAGELGDGMVSKWIVWGRAVSCLHNQAPKLKHNWLLVMEYTDIRYSDITTCIDSVSARAAQLEDRWSPNELYEGEQSHAYIIKHQLNTNWLLVMEYMTSGTVDIPTCIDSVSARAAQLGDGWSPNELCGGRAASQCLHNQAPNWKTIDFLWWNTLTSGTVTLLLVLILWVPELENWRTDGPPNELCEGEQSHAYIIRHPISTTIDFLWWNTLTSGTVTLLLVLIRECQSWRTGGRMGLQMNWYEGEQSHAYIINTQLKHQLTSCDGIHWHQVQWHYYLYEFCECQSWRTGGTDGLQMNCMRRAVSCLHNQAPNWNTIDSLWWNTLTSGTVTFLRVLILWVPEQHNWRTDGLQMNCVGEAVSCLHNQAPTFIWRPSVLQLCCSGTHRINTRRNVTVPDVSVFHHKESIVFQLGAWLCKHETALPHTIHLETIRPPVSPALALTESIQVVMSLYLMSVYSIARSQLCFNSASWLCKHETALLIQFIWRPSVPSSPALALTESIQVVMSLYLMSVYSITRSQVVSEIGCLIMVSMETALPPPPISFGDHPFPQFSSIWHSQNQYK